MANFEWDFPMIGISSDFLGDSWGLDGGLCRDSNMCFTRILEDLLEYEL